MATAREPEGAIRMAGMQDVDEILKLHESALRIINSDRYTLKQVAALAYALNAVELEDDILAGSYAVCADRHGCLLGFASFSANRITGVFVRPDRLRMGIGSRLLRYVEEMAHRPPGEGIQVAAALGAEGFYMANGYEVTGRDTLDICGECIGVITLRKAARGWRTRKEMSQR